MSSERSVPFYHYTSERGLEGILRHGFIEPSDPAQGDAREGFGTYGTNCPPSTKPGIIARNNWDGGWRQAMEHGKLDHYVRCEIPEEELERYPGHGMGFRGSILVHPEGVDLSKYSTKYGRVGMDRVPEAQLYGPARYGRDRLPEAPPYMDPWCTSQQATPILTGAWHQASDAFPVPSGQQLRWPTSDSEEYTECAGSNWQGNLHTSFGDGSYHYDNCDGSSYDRHVDGSATFVTPQGEVHEHPVAYDGECTGGHGHDERCDWGCSDGGGHADACQDDGEHAGHNYGGGCNDCACAEDAYSGGGYDGGYSDVEYGDGGYSDGGYSYGGYDDEW